ncbi:MAG: STT3 domain-containing protein, partial [Candidatus Woesearchaeota archaeon]
MKDDELSIFSFLNKKPKDKKKIKKEKQKENNETNYEESELKADFSIFNFDFLKIKNLEKLSFILLLLIPIILTLFIRTMPSNMPIAEEWARKSIEQNIKNNIAVQLSQQYPNLPQQNLMPLVEEQYKAFYSQQKQAIEDAVKQNSNMIREYFRDNKGVTYLGDIDSYYWLRYARNIVEKGHIEDEKRDGRLIDNRMTAPVGFDVDVNIYPYLIAYLYKFLSFFNKNITLMQASFYLPMVLSVFAIIIAFLLGRKLAGNVAGFIASILIAVNPSLLSRTLGSDNDLVNIIFPLAIMLFAVYAYDSKKIKNKILFSGLTGLFLGIYSFAWSGWWFMFLFLIAASFIYLGYVILFEIVNTKKINFKLMKSDSIKSSFIFLFVFLIFTFIGLAIFGNQNLFFKSFGNPFAIMRLKQAAKPSLWPNVYTTVAEMNEADFNQIIYSFGGTLFLLLAFVGTIFSFISFEEKNKNKAYVFLFLSLFYYLFVINTANSINIFILMFLISLPMFVGFFLSLIYKYKLEPIHSILLIIWFMATIYASSKGVRFIVLILPAFAISFGVFFSEIINKIANGLSRILDVREAIMKVLLFIVFFLFLIQPIRQGYATAYQYVPSVNDAWVETLTKINQESKENAIINSWWDFGHWFKYFADRAVTFDGASQNKPMAHWIGKALLTNDEKQAVAILRMLDCNSNNAFNYINAELNDTHESVKLVYKYLNMSKDELKKELDNKFSKENADKILNSFYCDVPENYFITSEDMVGKAPVWAHFGLWNFQRADYYNYFRSNDYNGFIKNIIAEYNLTETEAKKLYYEIASLTSDRAVNDWIAAWPMFVGATTCNDKKVQENNETFLIKQCNFGLQNNQMLPLIIKNNEAYVDSGKDKLYPTSFAFIDSKTEQFTIKRYNESKLG